MSKFGQIPQIPGLYWYRRSTNSIWQVVRIRADLTVLIIGSSEIYSVRFMSGCGTWGEKLQDPEPYRPTKEGYYWAYNTKALLGRPAWKPVFVQRQHSSNKLVVWYPAINRLFELDTVEKWGPELTTPDADEIME